jgi:hypothetical protein
VLSRLDKHNLRAKLSKCTFGAESVKFLGHVVSSQGIKPDPDKIKAIQDWPVPTNGIQVAGFLGICNFYRRHVPRFAYIARPLYSLLGDKPFTWNEQCQQAFDALKHALQHAVTLTAPDPYAQYILRTDASEFALGAALSQGEGISEKPIAFESRKLSPAESRYTPHDREMLAVVHALKTWKQYLKGCPHPIKLCLITHLSLTFYARNISLAWKQDGMNLCVNTT